MENFDPPQKDKRGRPINSEDAEARAAAKEKRRQKDAENKARAEERKKAAAQAALTPVPAAPAPAEETDAPNKKKRRRKKGGGSQTVQTDAPAVEAMAPVKEEPLVLRDKPPASVRTLAGDPNGLKSSGEVNSPCGLAADSRRARSAGGRGVRQGRLEDTLPDDPAMPVTDFYKPNPLDSDVIMDATARLLAPRHTAPRPQVQAESRPKPQAQKKQEKAQAQKPAQPQPRRQGKKPGWYTPLTLPPPPYG